MKRASLCFLICFSLMSCAVMAEENKETASIAEQSETEAAAQETRRPEDDLEVMLPSHQYELIDSVEVNGRQGVCSEGDYYWVSGSATLARYDKDWNLIALNDDPFKGYTLEFLIIFKFK